jgi:putative two-component system response regulator
MQRRYQRTVAQRRSQDLLPKEHSGCIQAARPMLSDTYDALFRWLAATVRQYTPETSEHTTRVGLLTAQIMRALRMDGLYVRMIARAAEFHDIGKLGVPQPILDKPTSLSPEEWAIMRTHPLVGVNMLPDEPSPFLVMARQIVRNHHERWDGSGYPDGLFGDTIPFAARVVAIADVFDALISRRPYKEPWPIGQAIEAIRNGAGTQFDPRLVDAFLQAIDDKMAR